VTRPAARPAADRPQLPALTGVRFLLAIWVVFHHLTGHHMMLEGWAQSLPGWLHEIVRGGYLAVGTFFLLSGFVLARSYGETLWSRRNLIRYGTGRLARVYPAYLLSLLIVSPFIYRFLANPAATRKLPVMTSYVFVLQGWERAVVHWNTPAWSLSCEFFFYLCFPLLAFCLRRRSGTTVAVAVAVAIALPAVLGRLGAPDYWKPFSHLADFLLGIAAAGMFERVSGRESRWTRRGWWFYVPAVVGGAGIVAFPNLTAGWTTLTIALRPMNFALVVGLGLGGGLPARSLSTRLATLLGNSSYSLYILHVPLLWWFSWYWGRAAVAMPGVFAAAYLILVVAASAAVFQFIEGPANRWIRDWVRARTR
jgi:peptidoglycan/LPS O-acetylase OafA/YrhL